jgi:hypothetical protein
MQFLGCYQGFVVDALALLAFLARSATLRAGLRREERISESIPTASMKCLLHSGIYGGSGARKGMFQDKKR